jgi:hypothetical protein
MVTKIAIICMAATIINESNDPWNQQDQVTLERAEVVCKEKYDSCVEKFIKKEPTNYWVICGDQK